MKESRTVEQRRQRIRELLAEQIEEFLIDNYLPSSTTASELVDILRGAKKWYWGTTLYGDSDWIGRREGPFDSEAAAIADAKAAGFFDCEHLTVRME